jgi:hypothetical protein
LANVYGVFATVVIVEEIVCLLKKSWLKKEKENDSTSLLLEWLPSRTQTTTNVDEDVGKKEPSYTAGGNVS